MKNTRRQNTSGRSAAGGSNRGFALLTVVFFMIAGGVLGMAAVALVAGHSWMTADEFHSQQAFDVAEAGLHYIAKQMEGDSDWSDNETVVMDFGPGNFVITYPEQSVGSATVQSDGTVGGITASLQQHFTAGGIVAFDKAIYTEQSIVVSGSAEGTVDGPVSAGGTVDEGEGVTFDGDIETGNADASVPVPDWTYWQSVADYVISGDHSFSAGNYEGIYYVTGNVAIHSDVSIKGTIITRGGVKITSSSNITIGPTIPNPAIVAEGDIDVSGSSALTINGFVISMGEYKLTGNSDIILVGGMVALEDVTFTGNVDIDLIFNEAYAPIDGFIGGESAGITPTAWRQVVSS